ncbi:MAG: phosphoribosylglycinamide formyltransferase [Coriobacteriia bacterium]
MSDGRRARIGVLISGSGTNLQAIMDACAEGRIDGEVVVVISDKEAAYGLERARKAGVDAVWIDRGEKGSPRDFNGAILEELKARQVDLVVMAGYMRLLGREVLRAYPHAVLNIHPALLPSFPGASGIDDAWAYGVKVTGVTVHFADEEFDTGPIIAQRAVEVREDDTRETLEARIHEVEHEIYPQVIQWWIEGRLEIEGRKVHVRG